MKITKKILERIIHEELRKVIKENIGDPAVSDEAPPSAVNAPAQFLDPTAGLNEDSSTADIVIALKNLALQWTRQAG